MMSSRPHEAAPLRSDETGTGPRALLVSVFGEFIRPIGGWIAVADLIRLMDEVGVDEQALRSAVSRLKRRGFLISERHGRAAGYRLSEHAAAILAAGDRRIYRSSADRDGRELIVVVFSVPERDRGRRHALRSRLVWLGCGNVSSGVWVAPRSVENDVRDLVSRLDLQDHVNLFRGPHVGPGEFADAVRAWWDLEALGRLYAEFLERNRPILDAWHAAPGEDSTAFVMYARALTEWRRLPFLDPGLPAEALPADWSGYASEALFAEFGVELLAAARRHVESILRIDHGVRWATPAMDTSPD